MARVAKPYTFPSGIPLSNYKFNKNYQVLYDEFDGNIDDSNFKAAANIDASKLLDGSITGNKLVARVLGNGAIDYTSGLIVRGGPNISANGVRLARGEIDYSFTSGVTFIQLWIPFATTATEGDPIFGVTPRVILSHSRDMSTGSFSATPESYTKIDNVFATGVLAKILYSLAPIGFPVNGKVYWLAAGGI